jgi:hypothetical protein
MSKAAAKEMDAETKVEILRKAEALEAACIEEVDRLSSEL